MSMPLLRRLSVVVVPASVLLLGCGFSGLARDARQARDRVVSAVAPTAVQATSAMTITISTPITATVVVATIEAASAEPAVAPSTPAVDLEPTKKPKPTKAPTPTPTQEPEIGPYSFYLNKYAPSCADSPSAEIQVVDADGAPLSDVELRLTDGLTTTVATSKTDDGGRATLDVADRAESGWVLEVADESGGGAVVRSPKVKRGDLDCEVNRQSVTIELQKGLSDSGDWPERQPISAAIAPWDRTEGAWSPEHVRSLNAWPRPPHDNGMGIHFLPIGYYADWVVDLLIDHMKELHMTWCVVLYNDDNSLRIAAERFRDAGIMVVWRPNLQPDGSYMYIKRDLEVLRQVGMPAYIQLFNEPEVAAEWSEGEGEIRIKRFADNWIKYAEEVDAEGGFPGLQVVDPDTLRYVIDRVKSKGKEHLFNQLFFVAHPYGSNHPPDYPYDANMQAREPGKTVDQDWFGTLGFQAYAHIFQEKLGVVPPIIIGEGGWAVTVHEDDKYPPVDLERHRDWHLEVFGWFKNHTLSNGEPLPDYLFAFCPWIIASGGEMVFDQASWYQSEQSGTKKATIKAMRRMPPFERRFAWESRN